MMFQTGDWVLYGVHGVCKVVGFEKQLVNRKRTEYMVLQPKNQDESKFFLPTANPTAMAKLQQVLSPEELRTLLASDAVRQDCWIQDENHRKQHYRDLISSGDREALLRMVSCLYRYKAAQAAAGKKFHLCDENFLRDAEKLLISEISLVLDKSVEDARDYLRETLKSA